MIREFVLTTLSGHAVLVLGRLSMSNQCQAGREYVVATPSGHMAPEEL